MNILIALLNIIIFITGILFYFFNIDIVIDKYNLNLGQIILSIQLLFSLLSIRIVDVDELGLIVFLGKPIKEVNSGPHYAQFPFCRLITETKGTIQQEVPGEPQDINEEEGKIPDGMVPPVRITFGAAIEDPEKPGFATNGLPIDDPYNNKQTVKISWVITWKIKSIKKYVESMPNGITDVKRNVLDLIVTTFTPEFAKVTPAEALLRLEEYNEMLEKKLYLLVDEWGIIITQSRVKSFGFSRALNTAVIDVQKAAQEVKAALRRAEGEAKKRERLAETTRIEEKKKGMGIASAKRLLLQAEAVGIERLATAMGTENGKLAQQLLTIKTALENSNYTILSTEGGMLPTIATIQDALNKLGGKKS